MTFERYKARKRIQALDGLRAIAVLLVVTVHMHEKVWSRLNGGLGVVIFFVLSGYLITMLALREEEKRGMVDLAAFYVRRTFRIFPLYYTVLAVYAGLILGVRGFSEKASEFNHYLPYYLLYLQEIPYFHLHTLFPFYQSWTLGVEEKFYLVWPVIAFGALTFAGGVRRIVTALLILIFVCGPVLFMPIQWYQVENYAYILMGALLAQILENRAGFAFLQRLGDVGLTVLLIALAALHFSRLQAAPRPYARTAYALIFMILLGILLITDGSIQRLLSNSFLGFIGELSYGIYLVHTLCLNVAEKVFPPGKGVAVPAYILTCTISIAVAYVLHRTVEEPMIHVGKMLSSRLQRKRVLGTLQTCG